MPAEFVSWGTEGLRLAAAAATRRTNRRAALRLASGVSRSPCGRNAASTIRPHSALGYRPPAPEAILPRYQGRELTAAYAMGLT